MTSVKSATYGRASVVGPSRTLGWLAVMLCGVVTAITPIADWSVLRLPPLVVAPVATLGMVLGIWYNDLAPRLAWNAYGVTVRSGWRVVTARWADVDSAWMTRSTTSGDRVILQIGGHHCEVGLDRLWWLARLSPRYTTRNGHLLEQMQLLRAQADDVSGGDQPPSLHGFAPLAAALACWSGGMVVALILV